MEFKFYEMGGPIELRYVFSCVGNKACCSAYWIDGTYNLDLDMVPIDPQRITGSLCQYMLKTLSKLHQDDVSSLIKVHISSLSRFINLVVKIGYEKLDKRLKLKMLMCLHEGVGMWKAMFTNLVHYEDKELKQQIKEIARYIIILEVILYDYLSN
jgi:hypothetical protein